MVCFDVQATAYSVRDRLIESWNDTQQWFKDTDPKRVYYLSMEFLMGMYQAVGGPCRGGTALELMLVHCKLHVRFPALSCGFLHAGRSLLNSIFNLGLKDNYGAALEELGFQLEMLAEQVRREGPARLSCRGT